MAETGQQSAYHIWLQCELTYIGGPAELEQWKMTSHNPTPGELSMNQLKISSASATAF